MDDITQDSAEQQARGQVAVVVAIVLCVLCLVLLAGLIGAIAVLLGAKAESGRTAREHQETVQSLETRAQSSQAEHDQIVASYKLALAQITEQLETTARELEQRREGRFNLELNDFEVGRLRDNIGIEPPSYPKPMATGVWEGELRLVPGEYAQYTLPFSDLNGGVTPARTTMGFGVAPFAFNQDGSKFFLVDAQSILRRFDSTTLQEEVTLALGGTCYDMGYTRGRLVLSFPVRDCLWIIDPQTMTVTGEVPLAEPTKIAAAPEADRVYAIGSEEMIAFDPQDPQAVRRLAFNRNGMLDGATEILNRYLDGFAMHPDGRHLFTVYGTGAALSKIAITDYGIEHVASVYAESPKSHESLAISRDGRFVAVPGWEITPNGGARDFFIYDANDPEIARIRIPANGRMTACDFDSTTQRIYVGATERVHVYTSDGELEHSIRLRDYRAIIRVAAFPMGGRLLVWDRTGMKVVDSQHERIKAVIPPPQPPQPPPTRRF